MKVFRGQAKNLKRNIKQNNMKPLAIVFGILVLITLTYTSTHSVMGVGNTMFKEGNGKRRVRRGRQGFEGTALKTAYRSGFSEGQTGGCEDGGCGFEGGRSGFREDQCDGDNCGVTDDAFTGGRVSGFEGFSSAKNAAPLRQGFAGKRKQGFKGKMRRRREGMDNCPSMNTEATCVAKDACEWDATDNSCGPTTTTDAKTDAASTSDGATSTRASFVGNRGRRRRR